MSCPPVPPPLPEPSLSKNDKTSKFVLKVKAAPEGYFFQDSVTSSPPNISGAPTGPYFFYGTLMDKGMLRDILGLTHTPQLRPAKIIGYTCRSWGQYPALVDGEMGEVVEGMVYQVTSQKDAERLAEYETSNYKARPVLVDYTDGADPVQQSGWAFVFNGRLSELGKDKFDLATWLHRMERA